MTVGRAEDGCPCFTAKIEFDPGEVGKRFRWGVRCDGPSGTNTWGVPTEVGDMKSMDRYREFELRADVLQQQDYYLTYARRLGRAAVLRGGSGGSGAAVFGLGAECPGRRGGFRQTRQRLHRG